MIKTGETAVSEAPLNIIRLWWMCSAAGSHAISLTIKHAWGESFITGARQSTPCPPHVFQHGGEERGGKRPVSLATKRAPSVTGMGKEEDEEEGRPCGGMTVHADRHVTSRASTPYWFSALLEENTHRLFFMEQRQNQSNNLGEDTDSSPEEVDSFPHTAPGGVGGPLKVKQGNGSEKKKREKETTEGEKMEVVRKKKHTTAC